MSKIADHRLPHLPPFEARLGETFARARPLAVVCIIALTGAGWLYLGLLTANAPAGGIFTALCRPLSAQAGAAGFAAALAMWGAMSFAMMLPSAGPTILTYAEIADTAARKGERVVSPLLIVAGFMAVWLGFALVAATAQMLLARAALIGEASQATSAALGSALFIAAGLYQFSALKQACLRLCRNPFSFFFTNWATTPRGVFRLGLRQGLYCLGCCWAMMLLMFAVGAMNVLWMAALGVVMTLEKMTKTARFAQVVGVVLLAIGAALLMQAAAI